MPGRMPLGASFMLSGESVCADAEQDARGRGFALPGAQALSQFADLLGGGDDAGEESAQMHSIPFPLPAMLPDDIAGEAELSCTIDFGALSADRAEIIFEHITGSGTALLDRQPLADFAAGPLTLDLTQALNLSKKQTLTLRFDSTRPAGVPGHVLLRTSGGASIEEAALTPNAGKETMTLRCTICARRAGLYRLIAQPCAADGDSETQPARELHVDLDAGEKRAAEMALCIPASVFKPGKTYAPAALKLLLVKDARSQREPINKKKPGLFARARRSEAPEIPGQLRSPLSSGTLCDSLTLICGYPGGPARAYVPLTDEEALLPPQELVRRAAGLRIPALAMKAPVSDALARALTLAGVQLVLLPPVAKEDRARLARLPAVSFAQSDPPATASLEASALRLSSMVTLPRSISADVSPAQLLHEAAGFAVDPDAPDVRERLGWLRAVSVRLSAEAARQGRLTGPVCAPGEWDIPDIRGALQTAFAPMHLSALPMRGAWWTLSRLSASLRAFLPEGFASGEPLHALVMLEDEEGEPLASCDLPCPQTGGDLGVFEAALPDKPCVLTLTCRLMCGEDVLEQSELPVYVGRRGPLEAAFR